MQRAEGNPEEKIDPCATCGKPWQCGVWGHKVCYQCFGEWQRVAPTHGEICAKYGNDDDSVRIYTELTDRWVRAMRARRNLGHQPQESRL